MLDSVLSSEVTPLLASFGLTEQELLSEAIVRGTQYSSGSVLPLTVLSTVDDVVFGEILFILAVPEIRFIIRSCPAHFNPALGCYFLHSITNVQCLSMDDVSDYYPLSVYEFNGDSLVLLRHQVRF